MSDTSPRSECTHRVLGASERSPFGSTRRDFMRLLTIGGGAALVAGATLTDFRAGSARAAAVDPVTNFGNAAVGAERIGIAFYGNALGQGSAFSVSTDLAKGTLLNSAHRVYFEAAFNQETQHLATLRSLGLNFPFARFAFPAGAFNSAKNMLAFGEALESIFIGAYLGAVLASAAAGNSVVAELAAQICGIECEHRVLIRDIAGLNPPNDRFFEGNQAPAQGAQLGDTGVRSTVYATGDAAVAALVALGIKPV